MSAVPGGGWLVTWDYADEGYRTEPVVMWDAENGAYATDVFGQLVPIENVATPHAVWHPQQTTELPSDDVLSVLQQSSADIVELIDNALKASADEGTR